MTDLPILGHTDWWCPNCPLELRVDVPVDNRFHACHGLKGLTAPMVPRGERAKVEAVGREDYVGAEQVQTDGDGRPIMSVVTTRDDGQDVVVFAPTAIAAGHAHKE